MSKKYLSATLLTVVFFAGGSNASAHYMSDGMYGHMSPNIMRHHMMKPGAHESKPAKLGVAIAAIPQAELDAISLEYGVRIEQVLQGSVAETGGLKAGDVVTEINGRPIYSPERLQHLIDHAKGSSTVAVMRDGEALEIVLEFSKSEMVNASGRAILGIRIQEMTGELKEAFGSENGKGVLISQVMNNSAAKQAGLNAGDVIVSIGENDIATIADVHGVLDKHTSGDTLEVTVVRQLKTEKMQVVTSREG